MELLEMHLLNVGYLRHDNYINNTYLIVAWPSCIKRNKVVFRIVVVVVVVFAFCCWCCCCCCFFFLLPFFCFFFFFFFLFWCSTFLSLSYWLFLLYILYADVNECKQHNKGGCSHDCENTYGSYRCKCRTGFQLYNRTTCEGNIYLLINLFIGVPKLVRDSFFSLARRLLTL